MACAPHTGPVRSQPQPQPPKLGGDLASTSGSSSGSDEGVLASVTCEISADFSCTDGCPPSIQPSCSHKWAPSVASEASHCELYTPLAASTSTTSTSLPDASFHTSEDLARFLYQMSLPSSRAGFFCKDIHFGTQLCWELADFVTHSPSLRVLTLSHCQLTDSLLEILLPFLASSALATIDLPNNALTDCGAAMLADLVSNNPRSAVIELQLNGNGIGDEGAAHLAGAMSSSRKLARLNLADNGITDVGCRALTRAVAAAGKLSTKTVQVSPGNRISAAAAAELSRTLAGTRRVLRFLSTLRG